MLYFEKYFHSKRGWAYFRQNSLRLILDSKESRSGRTQNDLQDDAIYTFTFHKGYFEMAILIYLKFSKPVCMQMPHHT